MQENATAASPFGRYPLFWAWLAGSVGFLGSYGVLSGILGASFWPERLSASDWVVALPLSLLVGFAIACVVWYHLAHHLPAWPIAGGAKDDRSLPRQVRISLLVLIAYIGLVFGEGVTILLYGSQGPFGTAFAGVAAGDPLLPVWTWPLAFGGAGGVMHWLCWSAVCQVRPDAESGTTPA